MTVCIAAICDEGSSVVLASDTMVTNPGIPIEFEHPTRKITRLSDTCVALTAGDALAYTELFSMVEGSIAELRAPSVFDIVAQIKQCYQRVRHQEIMERVLQPRGFNDFGHFYEFQSRLVAEVAFNIQNAIDSYDYGLSILVAGVSPHGAHVYGVSDPGTSQCYDAINFHAIGSGTTHALNTLIARSCHRNTPLNQALLILYEAKKMAEKAPGVGAVTDICIMSPGNILELPREAVNDLACAYEKWNRHEEGWETGVHSLFHKVGKQGHEAENAEG